MDRRNPYQQHHHHPHQFHQQQFQQQLQPPPPPPPPLQPQSTAVDPGGGVERFPQWSAQETKELLMIREELDQAFMETKRNKLLWEVVASKMTEKGFVRSPDQCKSKWKNLVTRFKGCEAMEPEAVRQQFPFYNEIQSILASRIQRMLLAEGGTGPSSSKRKPGGSQLSSEDEEEEYELEDQELIMKDELQSHGDTHQKGTSPVISNPRKRPKKGKAAATTSSSGGGSLKEVLEEFMRQMVQMEREWREAQDARERERERKEREWRKKMEELEKERVEIERRWVEREEERRVRDEARAQKRDALIDALLHKLTGDQDS